MYKGKIKVGDVFGKLSIIDEAGFIYEPNGHGRRCVIVRCECKDEFKIRIDYLSRGTASCRSCAHADIRLCKIGDRFDKLVVLRYETSNKKSMVICQCDCGNTYKIVPTSLVKNDTNNCGCSTNCFKGYEGISGTFFYRIIRNAKIRNIDFNLDIEYLWDLFLKQDKKCAITNLPISFSKRVKDCDGTASLDRIDSFKPYIKENIQWVHKDINLMKMDFSMERFLELCKLIVIHNNNK